MDTGFYPVRDLVDTTSISNDDVLLVDMGGSIGKHLAEFKSKWPDLPGRLILQDSPDVVASAEGLHEAIEVMPHDLFTPQPVQGMFVFPTSYPVYDFTGGLKYQVLAPTTCTPSSTTGPTTCAARSYPTSSRLFDQGTARS